jgi:membrane protein implicated in regulation of membrane protease activity
MVSEVAVPVASIEAGQHGRAELRGTVWSAHNVGATAVGAGQRCRVVAVNGLQLDIRPE